MFKILVVVKYNPGNSRESGAAITSRIIEFETQEKANTAFSLLKEPNNLNLEAIKLYKE